MSKLSGIFGQRFIPKSMPLLRQTLFFVVINTFANPRFEERWFICQGLGCLLIYLFLSSIFLYFVTYMCKVSEWAAILGLHVCLFLSSIFFTDLLWPWLQIALFILSIIGCTFPQLPLFLIQAAGFSLGICALVLIVPILLCYICHRPWSEGHTLIYKEWDVYIFVNLTTHTVLIDSCQQYVEQ